MMELNKSQSKILKRIKKEAIKDRHLSPKDLDGRWYVEAQFIEEETPEGYQIGAYGKFAKSKKSAIGATKMMLDNTAPYRLIIQDMKPKRFRMVNGEDGMSESPEVEEMQESLEIFLKEK